MSKDARQKMIVDYCTDWKSVEDICQYTQLEKAYLRNTILPKMEHLLEKMHDVPHHPKQISHHHIPNTHHKMHYGVSAQLLFLYSQM